MGACQVNAAWPVNAASTYQEVNGGPACWGRPSALHAPDWAGPLKGHACG